MYVLPPDGRDIDKQKSSAKLALDLVCLSLNHPTAINLTKSEVI